jgi:hypothetical protein
MKNKRRLLLSTADVQVSGIQPQPDFDPADPESKAHQAAIVRSSARAAVARLSVTMRRAASPSTRATSRSSATAPTPRRLLSVRTACGS